MQPALAPNSNDSTRVNLSKAARLAIAFSGVLGILYFITLAWQPFPGSAAIKGLSIAALARLAWNSGARLLALGLALSSIGDVLLDIRGVNLFVPGLCSFLFAHLVYTVMFVRSRWDPRRLWL